MIQDVKLRKADHSFEEDARATMGLLSWLISRGNSVSSGIPGTSLGRGALGDVVRQWQQMWRKHKMMKLSFQKEQGSRQFYQLALWGAEVLGREWTPDLISTEMSRYVLCSDVIYVFPLDVGVPPRSESSPLPVPFVTHCILDGDPPPPIRLQPLIFMC